MHQRRILLHTQRSIRWTSSQAVSLSPRRKSSPRLATSWGDFSIPTRDQIKQNAEDRAYKKALSKFPVSAQSATSSSQKLTQLSNLLNSRRNLQPTDPARDTSSSSPSPPEAVHAQTNAAPSSLQETQSESNTSNDPLHQPLSGSLGSRLADLRMSKASSPARLSSGSPSSPSQYNIESAPDSLSAVSQYLRPQPRSPASPEPVGIKSIAVESVTAVSHGDVPSNSEDVSPSQSQHAIDVVQGQRKTRRKARTSLDKLSEQPQVPSQSTESVAVQQETDDDETTFPDDVEVDYPDIDDKAPLTDKEHDHFVDYLLFHDEQLDELYEDPGEVSQPQITTPVVSLTEFVPTSDALLPRFAQVSRSSSLCLPLPDSSQAFGWSFSGTPISRKQRTSRDCAKSVIKVGAVELAEAVMKRNRDMDVNKKNALLEIVRYTTS